MSKVPIALVIFVPEKGLQGEGETPCTKTFNFFSKQTDSVHTVKGLHTQGQCYDTQSVLYVGMVELAVIES